LSRILVFWFFWRNVPATIHLYLHVPIYLYIYIYYYNRQRRIVMSRCSQYTTYRRQRPSIHHCCSRVFPTYDSIIIIIIMYTRMHVYTYFVFYYFFILFLSAVHGRFLFWNADTTIARLYGHNNIIYITYRVILLS